MDEALAKYNTDFKKSIAEIKPHRLDAIEKLLKSDVLCVLPTGYGKSLIYECVPYMCPERALVVVVWAGLVYISPDSH
jgi:superfamily II DNA helicase RecQ